MIQCWFIDVWCWQWRYCIRLENLGDLTVQLRERHWRIFSLSGTLETVRGRGVVGQEPVLSSSLPAFQYSSHVSLQAPSGHMWWDIYIYIYVYSEPIYVFKSTCTILCYRSWSLGVYFMQNANGCCHLWVILCYYMTMLLYASYRWCAVPFITFMIEEY